MVVFAGCLHLLSSAAFPCQFLDVSTMKKGDEGDEAVGASKKCSNIPRLNSTTKLGSIKPTKKKIKLKNGTLKSEIKQNTPGTTKKQKKTNTNFRKKQVAIKIMEVGS